MTHWYEGNKHVWFVTLNEVVICQSCGTYANCYWCYLWLGKDNWWYAAYVTIFACSCKQVMSGLTQLYPTFNSCCVYCASASAIETMPAAETLSRWVSPTHLFLLSLHLPFSVRWCAHREEKLAVCSRRPNALCQPAVPMVSAEICLFCWRPHSMPAVAS